MSERIRFRELSMKDSKDLFEIYSDKEAMKYRGSGPMVTVEDAYDFVRTASNKKDGVHTIRQGVELVTTKELIGSVMYRFHDDRERECEIGYSIGRKFWGQGLGKQVVTKLVQSAEQKDGIDTIIAWSNRENIASIRILEGLGFRQINQVVYSDRYLYTR